jgi:hypothetical protein
MDLVRRFLFHGSASSYGGHIYRPRDVVVLTGAASALPTVGGVSRAVSRPARFGTSIQVGRAETLASGLAVDRKAALAMSRGKLRADALSMRTTVTAKVEDVRAGGGRLRVQFLTANLESISPSGSEEPPFRFGKGLAIKGVVIDGFPLTVVLNVDVLSELDTFSKLTAAAADPKFVERNGQSLCMNMRGDGLPKTPPARLAAAGGTIYTTVVKELRWTKKEHPDAPIDMHSVVVPDFGRVIFGELLISAYARRLSMMRLSLGSPEGGDAEFSNVETNGSWYPPVSS